MRNGGIHCAFLFCLGPILWSIQPVGLAQTGSATDSVSTYNPSHPEETCRDASSCDAWVMFRKSHPWPYQALAVKQFGDEAVIVVSEPPPSLTRVQYVQLLQALFKDSLSSEIFCRWPTGLDGYLEDIVLRVRLNRAASLRRVSTDDLGTQSAPEDLVDRLRMLYQFEYGSFDGFALEPIDHDAPALAPLDDLKVPVVDLVGWVSGDTGRWRPVQDLSRSGISISALYKADSPGTFLNDSGITVLVIPKAARLADIRAPFRRFAVASDLIIGASGQKNGAMLLFGRSRTVPMSTLPPLRFESLAGFALNRASDIAQSYERQRIFAGKIRSGNYAGWDWAPILLSPQLDDTEFGTLLNFADQMLKSWSQHGDVRYYAFRYPNPSQYPFGAQSASDYFTGKYGTSSLLFNWNTDAFSTISRTATAEYLTASRTGALKILYRPSDSIDAPVGDLMKQVDLVRDASEKAESAQNYFADLGNPILVRVVQNVLLYQAVQNFLTIADPQNPQQAARSDRVEAVLQRVATKWLADAKAHRPTGPDDLTMTDEVTRDIAQSGLSPAELATLIASPQKVMVSMQRARQNAARSYIERQSLLEVAKSLASQAEDSFRSACASLNGTLDSSKEALRCSGKSISQAQKEAAFRQSHLLDAQFDVQKTALQKAQADTEQYERVADDLDKKYKRASRIGRDVTALSGDADLDNVLAQVLQAGTIGSPTGFIRTPSVVLSRDVSDSGAVGGHNISLEPPHVDLTPPRTATVVRASSSHTKKIQSPPTVSTTPARPVEEVLGKPRTGSLLEQMRPRVAERPVISPELTQHIANCSCDAIVTQNADGTLVMTRTAPPPTTSVIYGKSGMLDVMTAPPPLERIVFENVDPDSISNLADARALISSRMSGGSDNPFYTIQELYSEGPPVNSQERLAMFQRREGGQPETVSLHGATPEKALREQVSWRGAQAEDVSEEQWQSLFGGTQSGARNGTPRPGSRTVLTFNPGDQPGALGIRAEGNPGLIARVRAIAAQWFVTRPATPATLSDSVLELGALIRAKLKPARLNFYLNRNAGAIRAARLTVPATAVDTGS